LPAVMVSPETLLEEQAAKVVANNTAVVAASVLQIDLREIAIWVSLERGIRIYLFWPIFSLSFTLLRLVTNRQELFRDVGCY